MFSLFLCDIMTALQLQGHLVLNGFFGTWNGYCFVSKNYNEMFFVENAKLFVMYIYKPVNIIISCSLKRLFHWKYLVCFISH